MNYSKIKFIDIANGDGVRTSLYVSGCTNACKGCFNPQTWDFKYGEPFTDSVIDCIISSIRPLYVKGLSILGGDPMHPLNQKDVLRLIMRFREEFGDSKDIWMWTGYTYDRFIGEGDMRNDVTDSILSNIDVIVDGEFVEELKNVGLEYRGSENQRIIHLK